MQHNWWRSIENYNFIYRSISHERQHHRSFIHRGQSISQFSHRNFRRSRLFLTTATPLMPMPAASSAFGESSRSTVTKSNRSCGRFCWLAGWWWMWILVHSTWLGLCFFLLRFSRFLFIAVSKIWRKLVSFDAMRTSLLLCAELYLASLQKTLKLLN